MCGWWWYLGLLQYNHINWAIITTLELLSNFGVFTCFISLSVFQNYVAVWIYCWYFLLFLFLATFLLCIEQLEFPGPQVIKVLFVCSFFIAGLRTYFDSKSWDFISNTVHKSYFLFVSNFSYHLKVVLSLINNKKEMSSIRTPFRVSVPTATSIIGCIKLDTISPGLEWATGSWSMVH